MTRRDELFRETVERLSWALDLIEMYDRFLLDLGQQQERVNSKVHIEGKSCARRVLTLARVATAQDGPSDHHNHGDQP